MGETAEKLARFEVPGMNTILGRPYPVLGSGHVRVIDYMGGDEAIVQAARVSYGKGTKKVHEDRGLIRYLMRHYHTTPFEMCEIKLHVRVPMDHWRQWIRHRTANVNEYSTRYSEAIDDTEKTAPDKWRLQSGVNKQGSAGYLDASEGHNLTCAEAELHRLLRSEYERRIKLGVAKEQARKDLPLSTYTEAYWKVDLHNLLHFLRLRMDRHAQEEIRAYANVVGDIVRTWCPITWEAFRDYRLESMPLTRLDVEVIRMLPSIPAVLAKAREFGWLEKDDSGKLKSNRERDEFEAKVGRLGLMPVVPWV
jgi:thymidylate synthase (FAD)